MYFTQSIYQPPRANNNMGIISNTRIKEPAAATYDLYTRFMDRVACHSVPKVIADCSSGLTLAVVPRVSTKDHDLLFYRFAHMDVPVARITNKGDSLTLETYTTDMAARISVSEGEIQQRLENVLEAL